MALGARSLSPPRRSWKSCRRSGSPPDLGLLAAGGGAAWRGSSRPPELKRQMEDYTSVTLLRLLGFRWPSRTPTRRSIAPSSVLRSSSKTAFFRWWTAARARRRPSRFTSARARLRRRRAADSETELQVGRPSTGGLAASRLLQAPYPAVQAAPYCLALCFAGQDLRGVCALPQAL